MPPADRSRLGSLFEEAIGIAPEARRAFLDGACDGDEELREELTSLLAAYDASAGYFERLTGQVVVPALLALAAEPEHELPEGQVVSHYRIVRRLGGGGMGVVYEAIDLSLGRPVALKFLSPHLHARPEAEARLLAEARAASQLDHPHVGVIHEAGQTEDGRVFIAMARYDGETLDRRIRRGPVATAEAAAIARQVASALAAAHQKGIVHRDVKPSNILITSDGTAKLLDFGIAWMSGSDPIPGDAPGTPAYMSPEQTRGDAVDARTDLWSLGVVLHEMLAGTRPFAGADNEELIRAIRHEPAPALPVEPGALHAALVRIAQRLLEKDPAARCQSAAELGADLEASEAAARQPADRPWWRAPGRVRRRRLAYGAAVALAIVVLASRLDRPGAPSSEPAAGPPIRLAVLPLAAGSANETEAELADALTSELIAQLSSVGGLRVIAHSSVMRYAEPNRDHAAIGRELNVGALLEGALQEAGDSLRLTLSLVDTGSRGALWAHTYETVIEDLPAVQLEIAEAIAAALRAGPVARIAHAGTSKEAYTLYLKARHYLGKRDAEFARQALALFERAYDIDPTYAQAWAGWSNAMAQLEWLSIVPVSEASPKSQAAAERALDLNPELPEAHVSLARSLMAYRFEFTRAATHTQRALALNPSHPEARQQHASLLRTFGQLEEALEESRIAAALDPLSPWLQTQVGLTLYLARRYDEALEQYERVLDVWPAFPSTRFFVALVHVQRQEYEQALAALDLATPAPDWQHADTLRAYIHAVTGKSVEARERLQTLHQLVQAGTVSPWHPAIVHLGLGEHERALDLLQQAYEARELMMMLLPVEPTLDPLREHPRFMALVDKLRR